LLYSFFLFLLIFMFTVADAERLGAQVLVGDDTQWTRTALIRDPQGAEFTASQFTPPSG